MVSSPLPIEAETEQFQTERIMTVVGGHFVHDTFSAFVSPLLPILIERLSLSLTLAGSLAVFTQLPSLLSVLIGYAADRVSVRYLVIFAPAVTATLVTMLGFMPTYATAAILLFSVGISVMSFHAPAPAMVAHISGKQVGKGMSFFMAGGELGRSLGPLLVGFGVTQWGIEGLWRLMFFGWIATAVLYMRLHDVSARSDRKQKQGDKPVLAQFSRVFAPLFGVMILRNFVVNGLSVYLVVFLVTVRGYGLPTATAMLALYEFAGVAGALGGGTLSDRIGRRRTIAGAIALTAILMFAFLNFDGWLSFPILIGLGLTALSVTPVFQALVQDQLPGNRATASGMFILFAFLVRAINAMIVGILGDKLGLDTALYIIALLSLLSLPIVALLPQSIHAQE